MKTLKLIALAAFVLLFSQCKMTSPTAPSGPAPSLLEVRQILDTTAERFLLYADSTNGDPHSALMRTENWVRLQPNVQSATTIDSTYLTITLQSGLEAVFFFSEIDNTGFPIFRGGGKKSPEQAHISFPGLSKNTITNKKVLIYAPAWTEFNLQSTVPKTVSTLTNSGLGLDVTVLKDEECTPVVANTFKDYGLVILDTHGTPDSYMSGTILDIPKTNKTESQYKDAVILQLGSDVYDRLISKDYRTSSVYYIDKEVPNWQKRKDLKRIEKVYVTTQYIKTLPSMPNTVLFGNMCYSGYSVADPNRNITYPMKTAFMDKSPISYYGFAKDNGKATVVTDKFSKDMEDSLTKRLVKDLDSTGVAHLRPADGAEFYDTYLVTIPGYENTTLLLKHSGADDYSYEKCGDTLIDSRDGQKYPTVCIGKQSWMAENLRYNAPGSVCYDSLSVNCDTYGRLYNWATVMNGSQSSISTPSGVQGICPKGWHIPSNDEFALLIMTVGGDAVAAGKLKSTSSLWKSPNAGATNSSGFSVLPGGFASENFFVSKGESSFIWSTSVDTNPTSPPLGWAYGLVFQNTQQDSPNGEGFKVTLNSCRCLKD